MRAASVPTAVAWVFLLGFGVLSLGCAVSELTGDEAKTGVAGHGGETAGGGGAGGASGTGGGGTGATGAGASGGSSAQGGGGAGTGASGGTGNGGAGAAGGGSGGQGAGGQGSGGQGQGGQGQGGGNVSCVDYPTMIQPIFDMWCIGCHMGVDAPQNLHLDSYAGVMAGGLTGNEVIPCHSTSSLLHMKISMDNPPVGVRMPWDGPPYLDQPTIDLIAQWIDEGATPGCNVQGACSDVTPPSFGGLTSATLSGSQLGVDLCWNAATDDTTPGSGIVYDVWAATSPGGELFAGPSTTTSAAGATCTNIEGLTPGQQYCFVARARDEAGNRDGNTVEMCVTIPAAACVDYATMVQPIFTARCVKCHAGQNPPQNLHLDSYAGTIAGGLTGNEVVACQPQASLLYQKISMDNPPIGVRMPADGPPYLTQVQIDMIGTWISEGARASCAAPDPCSDAVPPTFGGLTSAVATNATTASLCWNAATDDLTPPSGIVYDVYEGASPGAENLAGLPTYSSAPGVLCKSVTALSPGSQYCWVVRARDGAGNHDANVVEKCVVMPAVPPGCVDYDTMVQPMLDKFCVHCHADPLPPQWLRLDSYEGLLAGGVRRNEVVACKPNTSLLINKVSANPSVGKRMPRDGPPFLTNAQIALLTQWVQNGAQRNCGIAAACNDVTAPTFGGIASATAVDSTTIHVCWNAATDAGTQPADMKYDLYEATQSGGQTFGQAPQITTVGQLCTDVKVGDATTMCFVVRARDLAGNRDNNQVELCATTPAASCAVGYTELVAPILAARCSFCHTGASPGHYLNLGSYAGVLSGGSLRNEVRGCNWQNSLINLKTSGSVCGNRMPRDGAPWLAPAETSVLRSWVASGARYQCADPATCGDVAPPVFGGVTSATALSPTTVELCWSPATDNTTVASSVRYNVYEAANPGGEKLNAPASYTTTGATCISIPTPSAAQSCYVVRAQDLVGNQDANGVEMCVTTPAGCFAYADLIQPIFDARCVHCHSGNNAPKGIQWDTYAHAISTGDVQGCDPNAGKLLEMVEGCQMPLDTTGNCALPDACLTPSQQRLLRQWITMGASQSCPWGCP